MTDTIIDGETLLGEDKNYLFYSDKVYSKMTGRNLIIYVRMNYSYSQLKRYQTINGNILYGTRTIKYPLTEESVKKYITESIPPTYHPDSVSV